MCYVTKPWAYIGLYRIPIIYHHVYSVGRHIACVNLRIWHVMVVHWSTVQPSLALYILVLVLVLVPSPWSRFAVCCYRHSHPTHFWEDQLELSQTISGKIHKSITSFLRSICEMSICETSICETSISIHFLGRPKFKRNYFWLCMTCAKIIIVLRPVYVMIEMYTGRSKNLNILEHWYNKHIYTCKCLMPALRNVWYMFPLRYPGGFQVYPQGQKIN